MKTIDKIALSTVLGGGAIGIASSIAEYPMGMFFGEGLIILGAAKEFYRDFKEMCGIEKEMKYFEKNYLKVSGEEKWK